MFAFIILEGTLDLKRLVCILYYSHIPGLDEAEICKNGYKNLARGVLFRPVKA